MREGILFFFLCTALTAAWAQTTSLPPNRLSLKIGSTNSPPLTTPDQNGYLDLMLKEAFKRIGVDVEFVILPSERSLVEADLGHIDGDNNRISGLESRYPNLVRVSEPNMTYDFMAFTTKPQLNIRSWEDLKPFSVTHIIGWKIFEDNVQGPQVHKVGTANQLFLLLKMNRTDVVLFERYGGELYLKDLDIKQAYGVEPPLSQREMYLYLNKDHQDLIPELAKAIRSMKADGTYQRIFQKT